MQDNFNEIPNSAIHKTSTSIEPVRPMNELRLSYREMKQAIENQEYRN